MKGRGATDKNPTLVDPKKKKKSYALDWVITKAN